MNKKDKIKKIVKLVKKRSKLEKELAGLDDYKKQIDKIRKKYEENES